MLAVVLERRGIDGSRHDHAGIGPVQPRDDVKHEKERHDAPGYLAPEGPGIGTRRQG